MVDIVHSVVVKKMTQKDVAALFRVSNAVVSNLVTKSKKSLEFLEEVRSKVELEEQKVSAITETTMRYLK